MGDPMAVDADMTEVIAATPETVIAAHATRGRGGQTLPAPLEDLLIAVVIDLTDIDIESLEKQPEMAFGNLVKKRTEVKVSSLTPQKRRSW